jgi:hypothetical protein
VALAELGALAVVGQHAPVPEGASQLAVPPQGVARAVDVEGAVAHRRAQVDPAELQQLLAVLANHLGEAAQDLAPLRERELSERRTPDLTRVRQQLGGIESAGRQLGHLLLRARVV